jgi:hypothetical protein
MLEDHIEQVGTRQGNHRLTSGDHLMITDMHAGGNPAEGAVRLICASSSRAIFKAALAASRLARCTSISAWEIA